MTSPIKQRNQVHFGGLSESEILDLLVEQVEGLVSAGRPRVGWDRASQEIAPAGDDVLVLPEFPNEFDSESIA